MNEPGLFATLTCPNPACQYQQRARIAEHACQLTYTCEMCQHTHRCKSGDCCVFCSYADQPCPSRGGEETDCSCGSSL
jgi:hypothetical protein